MANERLVVLQSIPTATVVIDGEEVEGLAMTMAATIDTQMQQVEAVPAISTAIYASGDAIGGLLEFEDLVEGDEGGGITIDAMFIIDLGKQVANLELVLFRETFTATADQAAFDPSDADLAKYAGSILTASAWSSFNDNAANTRVGLGHPVHLVGTSLFGQLVSRGTPIYASVSDLRVILLVRRD